MRIIDKRRGYFFGTHKGASIEIERDRVRGLGGDHHFYIRVRDASGGMANKPEDPF